MQIDGKSYQSIWLDENDTSRVMVIDQRRLPFFFEIVELGSVEDVYNAIRDMTVRGAPLIGAAGAFGIYLATLEITHRTNVTSHLNNAAEYLPRSGYYSLSKFFFINHIVISYSRIFSLNKFKT